MNGEQQILDCGHKLEPNGISAGYAVDGDTNEKICYDCSMKREMEYMRNNDKVTLYLVKVGEDWLVSNWTGKFEHKVFLKESWHNMAGVRRDVWFTVDGNKWWGTQYGDNTQICHCKKIKKESRWRFNKSKDAFTF